MPQFISPLELVAYLISCFGLSLTVLSRRSTCLLVSMADLDLATVMWGKYGGTAFWHGCVKLVTLKCEIPLLCLEQWMKEVFLTHILSLNLPPSSTLPLALPHPARFKRLRLGRNTQKWKKPGSSHAVLITLLKGTTKYVFETTQGFLKGEFLGESVSCLQHKSQ